MFYQMIANTNAQLHVRRRLIGVLLAVCLLGLLSGAAIAQDAATEDTSVPAPLSVNVNLDDALTLSDLLTGIGPARADAIVEFRETNGLFRAPEDLLAVSGIGPATLESIRAQLEFSVPE